MTRSWTASLPMYDLPEIRAANEAFWTALATRLEEMGLEGVPAALTRQAPLETLWHPENTLLSQCCGFPVTHGFRDRVRPIATLHYAAEGCDGIQYSSAIITNRRLGITTLADLKGRRVAINDMESQSGRNCLRAKLAGAGLPSPFFAETKLSGGHRASLAAVARGDSDAAAIDGVTLALIAREAPGELADIQILDWSDPAPGLPLVTGMASSAETIALLRRAIADVVDDPAQADICRPLLIRGVTTTGPADYEAILEMERSAGDFRLS